MPRKPRIFSADWSTSDLFTDAHQSVTAINRICKPLTAEQVIERGLVLAKAEPSDQDIARALFYYSHPGLIHGSLAERNLTKVPPLLQNWWADCKSERSDFLSRLDALMQSPYKARARHMAADLKLLRENLLITADLDGEGKTVCRYFPRTIKAGYIFVLQALYNKKQKRWKRLRKCGHCQSIFFRKISEAGGRPRDYCSSECQKKHDQERALVRQRSPEQRAKQRQRKRDRK